MYLVTSKETGSKLVDFLSLKLEKRFSLRKIKQAIECNFCKVNGKTEHFYSYRLHTGDRVQFDLEDMESLGSSAFRIENDRILFEDDDLLIYNKPSGLTSDPEGVGALFTEYEVVHRLDKETTGAIILAKSARIKNKMIELFKDNKVDKVYLALVDGIPKDKKGSIVNYLGRISRSAGHAKWGIISPKRGQYSKTRWSLEKKGAAASMIRCIPITGRTHQLRIHMKEIGHPILGDFRYTKAFNCPFAAKRALLHAYEITFPHPEQSRSVYVKAPIPSDFKRAMQQVL